MGIFNRKSKWEHAYDAATGVVGTVGVRRAAKLGAGLVVGLVGMSAMSAAVSAARHQDQ